MLDILTDILTQDVRLEASINQRSFIEAQDITNQILLLTVEYQAINAKVNKELEFIFTQFFNRQSVGSDRDIANLVAEIPQPYEQL